MPATGRRKSAFDLVRIEDGSAVQRCVEVALVGTALVFWRALAEPFQLPKFTILVLAALVGLVLVVLRRAGLGWVELPPRAVLVALGLFLVGLVVAVVTSSKVATSFVGSYGVYAGLATYVAAAVLALAAASAYDEPAADRFLGVASVVAVLAGLYALLQWAGGDPFTWLQETTVFATFGNANFAAGWLGSSLPLILGWTWRHRDDQRSALAGLAGVAVVAAAILATRSFQGLPAAIVGVGVWAVILVLPERAQIGARVRELPARARQGAVAAAAVVVVAVGVFAVKLPHGLSQGLIERRFFWRAALDVFRDHPLVGSGLDTFGNQFFPHRAAEHAVRYGNSSAEELP